jgi:hypothetical protein
MSFENARLRCRNCKFWWPLADEGHQPSRQGSSHGQCRRHAPPALLREEESSSAPHPFWAVTSKDDWCGEHMHSEM